MKLTEVHKLMAEAHMEENSNDDDATRAQRSSFYSTDSYSDCLLGHTAEWGGG